MRGVAYDTPILGYRSATANLLRLWKAEASESFDFQAFNAGDYYRAVERKVASENIGKVLYPNDEPAVGRELRLSQQYFFVSCSLHDMIRIHLQTSDSVLNLQASAQYRIMDNVGVGVSYRYVDYDLDVEKDTYVASFDYQFKGPSFFIEIGF